MINLTATQEQLLFDAAKSAQQRAYAPYSQYPVGAALMVQDGAIFTGCNIENAAYPATICAERTAAVKAVSEGHRVFTAMALITETGGAPCGICRQVLNEFGPTMAVYIYQNGGKLIHKTTLDTLLPFSFGPKSLEPVE